MLTAHAALRVAGRLSEDETRAIEPRLSRAIQTASHDAVAFVSEPLGRHYAPDGSNGDTLVAVVRSGGIVTVMWRRSTQPFTPNKFNVSRILRLPL